MLSFLCRESLPMQITCSKVNLFCSSSQLIPVALPSQREIHLWNIIPDEVKDASLLSQYLNVLSPCEKENVFRMRGDKLQKRALLARILVRTTLARYTDSVVSPSSLKFRKNAYGKPEVEWHLDKNWDPPSLQFNISHTSSLISCGVTVGAPIGIDVEEKQRKTRNSLSSFAQRYLSSDEVAYLQTFPDPEIQRKEFLKLWTLKEAYVKALGRGFSAVPFKTFSIWIRGTRKSSLPMPGYSNSEASEIIVEVLHDSEYLTTKWKFCLIELESSHYAAICVERKIVEGEDDDAVRLKVWKTIPFVKDEFLSQTNSVKILTRCT